MARQRTRDGAAVIDDLIHHFRDWFTALTELFHRKPLVFFGGAVAVVVILFVFGQIRAGRGLKRR